MDKFIGFDIDHKPTLACLVQTGQPNRYRKLPTDVGQLREWTNSAYSIQRLPWHVLLKS